MNNNGKTHVAYEMTPGITFIAVPEAPEVVEVPERKVLTIPTTVAVARSVGSPVEWTRTVNAPAPERFTWAIFQPLKRPDPAFPVPRVDLGDYYFNTVQPFGKHYLNFNIFRQRPREWATVGDKLLQEASTKLGHMVAPTPEQRRLIAHTITEDEYGWLMGALWQLFAEPSGYPAVVRDFVDKTSQQTSRWPDDAPSVRQLVQATIDWAARIEALRLENEQREAEAREREAAAKEKARLERDRRARELAYGGDGISIDYGS